MNVPRSTGGNNAVFDGGRVKVTSGGGSNNAGGSGNDGVGAIGSRSAGFGNAGSIFFNGLGSVFSCFDTLSRISRGDPSASPSIVVSIGDSCFSDTICESELLEDLSLDRLSARS